MGTGDMEKCNGSRSRSIWRQQHSSGPLAAWTAGSSDALGERSYRGSQPNGPGTAGVLTCTCPLCCPCPCFCLQALVDFPGQTRRVISFKRMALTDFTVDIPRLAKKSVLAKALEEAGE